MFKLRIKAETALTPELIDGWYTDFCAKEKGELSEKLYLYLNKKEDGTRVLKVPYAKKLVFTSAATTISSGVKITPHKEAENNTFKEVCELFKKQGITAHDAAMVKDGCIFGKAYELVYWSDDEVPVPKVAKIDATNAFVVYDDTVEQNSLFGVYFDEYKNSNGATKCRFHIYDREKEYEYDNDKKSLMEVRDHNLGRVPLTEYQNNDEQQGDFEQVIELMKDRTFIHNTNIKDIKDIAKNYLKGRNIEFKGRTEDEKKQSMQKAKELQLIEVTAEDANDDIGIMSKVEDYSSVDVFGKDIDRKIYDLTMIPDLSDDNFAGNQTGVALQLKLLPFKELVKEKDAFIKRLYQRRLKMYIHALNRRDSAFGTIDVAKVDISIKRIWAENTLEIAQIITALGSTGLFSDEYLVSLLHDADYKTEKDRKDKEAEEKAKKQTAVADPNNFSLENLVSLLRGDNGVQ